MNTPFFSVVIPTYNRANYLERCIRSVLEQTLQDFEIIVVDDGSVDNTRELVSSIQHPAIRYFWKENGERGAARNYGVRQAVGNYIFFLDSDDWLYKNHLEHAYDQLQRQVFPMFFHSLYIRVDTHGKVLQRPRKLHPQRVTQKLLDGNVFSCKFFLKKEPALQNPFLEDRNFTIGEDWYVILRIMARFPIFLSNEVTNVVHMHAENSMANPSVEKIIYCRGVLIDSLKKDEVFMRKYGSNLGRIASELTSLAALESAIQGNKRAAFRYLWQAARQNYRILLKRRFPATMKYLFLH